MGLLSDSLRGHPLSADDVGGQLTNDRLRRADRRQHHDVGRIRCGAGLVGSGESHREGADFVKGMRDHFSQVTAAITEIPLEALGRAGATTREGHRFTDVDRVSIKGEVCRWRDQHGRWNDRDLDGLGCFLTLSIGDEELHEVRPFDLPDLLYFRLVPGPGTISEVPRPRVGIAGAEIGKAKSLSNGRCGS